MNHHPSLLETVDQSDRIWHLSRACLLAGLGDEDLKTIVGRLNDRIVPEGQVIFNPGDSADQLYFVNRGSVRLSLVPDSSREKTIEILKGGDVFGIDAVGGESTYHMQAVAHEETWLSAMRREDFFTLARERPVVCHNLIQLLMQQVHQAHEEVKELCFLDIQQRLIQALLRLGQKHGHRLASRGNLVRLKLRLSHDFLARLTGANRPYLSNIMSSLKKKGWIQYQRKHLLIDVDALERGDPLVSPRNGSSASATSRS